MVIERSGDKTASGNSSPAESSSGSIPIVRTEQPPRAPLVLRVGVTGHRPNPEKRANPDVKALRAICRKLLLHIQDTFAGVAMTHGNLFAAPPARSDDRPAGLRVISSLAEGADQWVAAEARDLSFELQAVLPFARDDYEKDFTGSQVLKEHRRLRELASAVFELDGSRDREADSYLAAGRVLLNQSDLLIAVWDGEDAAGVGGTGQIVREALQRGIPILWINWNAPTDWQLMRPAWRLLQQASDVKDDLKLLERRVLELLLPPPIKHSLAEPSEKDLRESYFSERRRRLTWLGGWWSFFRDLLRGKFPLPAIRIGEFIALTQKDWAKGWQGTEGGKKREHKFPPEMINWVQHSYLSHYAWANQLSIYYANLYRSSFVWIYLFGALAVLLATIGSTLTGGPHIERIFIVAEIVVIGAIIGLTWLGGRQRWHQRWIDYRTLAERLRLSRFSCLLGGVLQQATVPPHLATYGNPAATWMHWHFRAVERAAGLPGAVVTREYLAATRELLLEALIAGQEEYHEGNATRLGSVDHRLHSFGRALFLVTLAACVFHLVIELNHEVFGPSWAHWLVFGAAFLPALGAAMAAVRSQGEFPRVVQRSRAMREELAQLGQAISSVPTRPNELNSQRLQQEVEHATRLMYNEVLDWRIVFQDRPLVWPA